MYSEIYFHYEDLRRDVGQKEAERQVKEEYGLSEREFSELLFDAEGEIPTQEELGLGYMQGRGAS